MANQLNLLRNRSTDYGRPVEDQSREAKKFLFLLVAFSSRSKEARPDEVTFCYFWLLSLETYKLIAPLHLLTREHLHSIVYLPVIDQKALIYFIVH